MQARRKTANPMELLYAEGGAPSGDPGSPLKPVPESPEMEKKHPQQQINGAVAKPVVARSNSFNARLVILIHAVLVNNCIQGYLQLNLSFAINFCRLNNFSATLRFPLVSYGMFDIDCNISC